MSAFLRRALAASALTLPAVLAASAGAGALSSEPLAARSGPRGPTLFKVIAPAVSGVVTENSYTDPRMWGDRHREFEVGAAGTGVAIADFDGDGRPDLFVVSKVESGRLFRNLGDWTFADVTEQAGVADHGDAAKIWKQGATFADVDNDGRPDLYVCRFGAPNLLYINQGDGTFREEAGPRGLAVNDASVMAAFCDYDRDGWLDVFVLTNVLDTINHPAGQRNYLFHNNGDGTFTNVTARAGITGEAQGHSCTWWDYDGDGWPDLHVANDFAPPDRLYHNNRDGTFTDVIDRVVPHLPYSAMGSDFGDVNNDGRMDFLVAEMAATTHEKDQRTMASARSLLARDPPDGSAEAPSDFRNALYLNTGTPRMQEAALLAGVAATDWTWSVRFEDLDNDGRVDLYLTNGMHRESHNVDLLDRLMLAATPADKARIERAAPVLAEANLAFRNLGDLRFENVGRAWGLDQVGVSYGAAFGDLDGDGDLDLIFTNYQKGATLLRNDSDTGHRILIALRGTRSNRFGVGATVRLKSRSGLQVRQLVLARGLLSSSEPVVHFGLGNDPRIDELAVSWPSGAVQTFRDVAVDRKITITEPADAPPPRGETIAGPRTEPEPRPAGTTAAPQFKEISAEQNVALVAREAQIDETSQQPLLPFRQNRRGPALAAADLDGDDHDDLVIGGTSRDPARVLLARGGFQSPDRPLPAAPSPLNDGPILAFDANADGSNDLLVTKGGVAAPGGSSEYQPHLYLNDGHGAFRPAAPEALPPFPVSVGAACAADCDGDGQLDVFVGARLLPGLYPLPPKSALWLNRGGRFEDVTERFAPELRDAGMVTAALWSDVDLDGWPDLLVAVEWGEVRYFHNRQGRGLEDWTRKAGFASAGTGWWTSLVSADFNGDGRPDFVAGNVGLNTQYRASPAHPALLFAGDFNDDGGLELVEGTYENDTLYPWRTRKDMGAVIPGILKRFPKNDSYARAPLETIVGAEKLQQAQRFAATELRSGVFLSQADGTYHFAPLPRIAQISPLQGMVAGDFDGDGHADLYAVQNSYAPIPLIGRFDGGLSQLLRGDGHGGFTAAAPAESGLVVPGDAKALAALDVNGDGWADFVVTRNDSPSLLFRNNGRPEATSVQIRLRGQPGNLAAIGARITVVLADGSTESSEIQAGSGYYSQSSPAAFVGWPGANPAREIRVRWPSGVEKKYPAPAKSGPLILSEK